MAASLEDGQPKHAPAALAWYEEAEAIVRGLSDRVWLADAVYNTGTTAALIGDMPKVIAGIDEGSAIGRELGDDDAARHYREALRVWAAFGDAVQLTEPLLGLAAVMILTGKPHDGVRWLAANQAIRERLGGGPPPEWLRLGDPVAVAREALDDATYQRAWEPGLSLSLEMVIAETTA